MLNNFLVVGAGFAGAVVAERLASQGHQVLVIDRRSHIGGNAFDKHDDHGVLIHPYGPHIFHTNDKRVFEYLSRFTHWRFYEHRVLAFLNNDYYPIPINRTTINKLYGMNLDEAGIDQFLEKVRDRTREIMTSEDVLFHSVGRDLCDKFFRGYTKKQWGLDLSQLSSSVAARVPARIDSDDRYFQDKFQFMPSEGYTPMFRKILDHPNIRVELDTDFKMIFDREWRHIFYTGPIDEFYGHRFGPLPYRSLKFDHKHASVDKMFPAACINFPEEDVTNTRVTEFKALTGQTIRGTSVCFETPSAEGDPYYPIPMPDAVALYRKYQELADQEQDVTFVGRLAQYRYYNMDQVTAAALTAAKRFEE